MTRRLIEDWLPIAELSEECTRERRSMTALPPIYYLHVWWARRPLIAARAAVMASLLPSDTDRTRFLHALGIHGDPVAAQQKMAIAKRSGQRVEDPYGYKRAFTYSLSAEERSWFRYESKRAQIEGEVVCLDPTAGGGSIPFEALRMGLNIAANDINPVASLVEKLTIALPYTLGTSVIEEYKRLAKCFRERLEPYFATLFPVLQENRIDTTYLFARTLKCPYCGASSPSLPIGALRLMEQAYGFIPIPKQMRVSAPLR